MVGVRGWCRGEGQRQREKREKEKRRGEGQGGSAFYLGCDLTMCAVAMATDAGSLSPMCDVTGVKRHLPSWFLIPTMRLLRQIGLVFINRISAFL